MIASIHTEFIPIEWIREHAVVEGNPDIWSGNRILLCNDTRELPGEKHDDNRVFAFIALQGNRDGHQFIADAINRRSQCFILNEASRSLPSMPAEIGAPGRESHFLVIWTKDTFAFLGNLASKYRRAVDIPVILITGSNGKTSFKEILSSILGPGTYKTRENYNNEIGLPFTILDIPIELVKKRHIRYIVLEAGMNHRGEIRNMSRIALPDIGVITNIGPAHLAFFNSIEDIARAKLEIVEGIRKGSTSYPNGILFYGGTPSDAFSTIVNRIATEYRVRCVYYGSAACEAMQSVRRDGEGFSFVYPDEEIGKVRYRIGIPNEIQVENCVGAIRLARLFGEEPERINERLRDIDLPAGRFDIQHGERGITLILDDYNANPVSMHAGIRAAARWRNDNGHLDQRIVWILGEMKELGNASKQWHRELGMYLRERKRSGDILFAVGDEARELVEQWQTSTARWFPDVDSLKPALMETVQKDDILFIKGSHSVQLKSVAELFDGRIHYR